MTNSKSQTPESPRETTEAFKKTANEVGQETPANTVLVDDEKYNQLKSNMRTQMLEAGLSQEAIAYAEKMSDLRREFIQEALKLKNQSDSVHQSISFSVTPGEADKHYKQSEEAVAEMLLLRKQAQQPTNTDTHKKKPD